MTRLVNSNEEEESKVLHKSSPALLIVPLIAPKIIPDSSEANTPKIPQKTTTNGLTNRAIFMQLIMSIFANITILSTGMGLAFPSVSITAMMNATDYMRLDENEFSWFASLNAIICPIGGLMVSLVLDRFGRKNTFFLINVFSFSAWITVAMASTTDRQSMYATLLAGRILIGISSGLSSSPCAIYTAEIAHSSLRGRMSILSSLGISVGILFVYVCGYFIPTNWRLIAVICAGWSVLAFVLVIFLPETPSWLVSRGRVAEAECSLKLFRGLAPRAAYISRECRAELDVLLEKNHVNSSRGNQTLLQKFALPEFYKPLGIMVGFFAFQQFSGLFVLIVYAVKFSLEAGVVIDPFLCAVGIGIVRIVGTLMMGVIMDRFGRRRPAMLSSLAMAACMFGIGGYIASGSMATSWLPLFLILSFIFSSSLGLLTLPFTMMAEVFPQRFRGLASGITIGALFTMSFVVTKLYPTMVNEMGNVHVFVFYGVVSLLSFIYVFFVLPETKGKTLEQIEDLFKKRVTSTADDVTENLMLKGNVLTVKSMV